MVLFVEIKHAMQRVGGSSGRFAKKTKVDALKHTGEDKNKTASGSAVSSQSTNSSGIKRMCSDTADRETRRGGLVDSCNARTYVIGGAQASTYQLHSSDGREGGTLGQQWISIPSNQASWRAAVNS